MFEYIVIGKGLIGAAVAPYLPVPVVENFEELRHWFQSGGSQSEAEALKEVLLSIVPRLKVESFRFKPCVTTHTSSGRPYIDVLEPQQLFVAAGGNGAAAKSSMKSVALLADWLKMMVG